MKKLVEVLVVLVAGLLMGLTAADLDWGTIIYNASPILFGVVLVVTAFVTYRTGEAQ